jgi:hypothetical protein
MSNLNERFEALYDKRKSFSDLQNKRHNSPDICAFLLLSELCPAPGCKIIKSLSHDEIFLNTNCHVLDAASDDDILTLISCGVRFDSKFDCLTMWV